MPMVDPQDDLWEENTGGEAGEGTYCGQDYSYAQNLGAISSRAGRRVQPVHPFAAIE